MHVLIFTIGAVIGVLSSGLFFSSIRKFRKTPVTKIKNLNKHPAADGFYYQIGNAPFLFTLETLAYGAGTFDKNKNDIK